jgi:hypothetical protein
MRRSSSTWLFSACLALGGVAVPAAAARSRWCLPPVFEEGRRLGSLPNPGIFWLELLLRQHELCWRTSRRPGEIRVVLAGNSSVYGFPLPVKKTFGHLVNRDFAHRGVPAHLFNLGFAATYQLKDALVIHEALRYDPDVILYPVTLAEFHHVAPVLLRHVHQFFDSNIAALAALVVDLPPGLEEVLTRYRVVLEVHRSLLGWLDHLKESGEFLRRVVQRHARSLAPRVNPPSAPVQSVGRQTTYDCPARMADFSQEFSGWQSWNILAYLEYVRNTRGVDVMVVNWPVAHEPVGDCYNVRYPAAAFAEYNTWLREETAARGLRYVDLHDLLPPRAFLDSLHVGPSGHRQIADRLATALAPWLSDMLGRRARSALEAPSPAAR